MEGMKGGVTSFLDGYGKGNGTWENGGEKKHVCWNYLLPLWQRKVNGTREGDPEKEYRVNGEWVS